MVKKYLEKYQDSLLNSKVSFENEYKDLEIKLEENINLRQLLQEKEDPNFEAFTPYVINSKNKDKINELINEEESIEDRKQNLKCKISELDNQLAELGSVIHVASENEKTKDSFLSQINQSEIYRLKLLETQENERQRIARDLHDSSVQNLTNLVHKIELCSKLIDLDPVRCKLELMTMSKVTRDIICEMRELIYNLRPMSFDDIGLDVTIERELERLKANSNVNISLQVEGEKQSVNSVVGITLLRIIQEACNNAIKHAEANIISVHLIYHSDSINIIIQDDGKGFDVNNIVKEDTNTGFGLSMMKERVYLLSGNITIDSKIGVGTKIVIEVSKDEEENK